MSKLTDFLLARIGDDEVLARNAMGAPDWWPARVLAECEAKRRIVEDWVSLVERLDDRGRPLHLFDPATSMLLKATAPWVRGLGGAYADHPDYRQEWAV